MYGLRDGSAYPPSLEEVINRAGAGQWMDEQVILVSLHCQGN